MEKSSAYRARTDRPGQVKMPITSRAMAVAPRRFGCQRCRDRNLACTYSGTSQFKRRKAGRQGGPGPCNVMAESMSSRPASSIATDSSKGSGRAVTMSDSRRSEQSTTRDTCVHNEPKLPQTLTNLEMQTLALVSPKERDQSSGGTSQDGVVFVASTFTQPTIPEPIDTGFDEWDMQLFDAELVASHQDSGDTMPDTSPDSCISIGQASRPGNPSTFDHVDKASGESAHLHLGSFPPASWTEWRLINHPYASTDMEWNTSSRLETQPEAQSHFESPLPNKTTSSGTLSRTPSPLPFSSEVNVKVNNKDPLTTYDPPRSQANRPLSSSQHASRCRCMSVTLGILERIQNYTAVTSFRRAERALFFLKESISNCHGLVYYQSCRNPPRLMTFSILVAEKMIGVLEGIATFCETKADETHGNDTILFGEYRINSTQERCEVLGVLILLQVKRLGALSGAFTHQAGKGDWASHQAGLRPIVIRIRELREAVEEMTTALAR
ncbi:hypothetical protein EDB81DRAFT_760485 [Dactylonectria macrodidyma]|uniref:Zn(2)-C6 fungal-type domain-containing protein n=1 Tax=Dactylonectria macrodidyma TaxID=307937 RepID=A0A9P9J577_9HYPO|nr:hypothetical protein EDB81DRAFT_760485 [Dactylonectria macrodidyma]